MKTILIIIFLLLCLLTSGQNAIGLTFSGNDLAIGGRFDHQFSKYGFYTSAGFGKYNAIECGKIKHQRISLGIVRYSESDDMINTFSLGINAHNYQVIEEGFDQVPRRVFFPVSFEAGTGIIINHAKIEITLDPLKRDVLIGFSIVFNSHKHN
jgi:hypothetical protein